MKIKSSLKIYQKRDLNSKLVRRRGRVYIINKNNPKFKARQNNFMDNDNHKNTWNNFTKFVLLGNYSRDIGAIGINGNIFTLRSINENWIYFRKSKN